MNFEFNVSLNGRHLFATHKRSVTDSDTATKVRDILVAKFPESEGYNVIVTINPARSYGVSINADMKKSVDLIYKKLGN
jgi:hypothetical protein